jgi:type IX secretion system PorP/SprF family membrane protein
MIYQNFTIISPTNKIARQPYFSFLLLLFLTLITSAQQTPHYTQYLYNMQVLNPAFIGVNADLSISLLSRQQWVGVEGAPETSTFSINGRISAGLGFGATIIKDKIGLSENTNINIDGSYTIPTSEYGRLSFGIKAGINIFENNLGRAITPDNDVYPSNSGRFPNIGFGALYYGENFFIGLSIPNLLQSDQFKTLQTINSENTGVANSNYFLAAGLVYQLSDHFKFKPSTIIKYTSTLPMSIDINSNFVYRDKIEAGISYRYKNSLSAMFSLILNKKYRVGYAYDYQLTNYGTNLSSHEIILRFDVDFKKNTRWLFHNKCYF